MLLVFASWSFSISKKQLWGVILAGRVTFDEWKRVLPGLSIILTQDQAYDPENDAVLVGVQSKEEVLEWYQNQEKNLYIIGGSQI